MTSFYRRDVLKQALSIIWRKKYLWFIGLFAGLTAYDTQKLRQLGETGEQRHALIGALMLYLDFVNLFLFLLRFMGRRRD